MNSLTLKHIKSDLSKLYETVTPIIEYFTRAKSGETNSYELIVCQVLLQNAKADTSHCQGYSHKDEVEKIYQIRELLKGLADYDKNSHVINFVYNEVDMIIMGHDYSEEVDTFEGE